MGKLSERTVMEIVELYQKEKVSIRSIAKKYHLSTATVHKYLHRCLPESEESKKVRPIRHREPRLQDTERSVLATHLIEAMSDFALADGWTEEFLMQQLLACGLKKEDFKAAGYQSFYLDVSCGECQED